MLCRERLSLLREYNQAIRDCARATQNAAEMIGVACVDDFRVLIRERQRACARVARARHAYEDHLGKHGCDPVLQFHSDAAIV